MKPTDTAVGIDAILDSGAEGLRYFEVFVPRYRDWTGRAPESGDYTALAAGYDRERGMDLESLRAFATVLGTELDQHLDQQAQVLSARAGGLPAHWNGSAAAANAHRFLADAATRAATGLDTLRTIHSTVSAAVTRLGNTVRGKADTVIRDHDPDTVGGRTPQQIDWIIDCARHRAGPTADSSVIAELRAVLPENAITSDADAPAVCVKWLDTVFVPELEARSAAFVTLCDTTHITITGIYDEIVAALGGLPVPGFMSPGGCPSADTDLAYTSGHPAYMAALGTAVAATTSSGRTTASAQDSSAAQTTPTGQTTAPAVQTPSLALESTPTAPSPGQPSPATTTEVGPSSLALTATPVADTTDQSIESTPTRPDTGSPDTSTTATTGEETMAPEAPASTAAPGQWTPADIAGMVTAVGQITGTIPEFIEATATLVGNLDEIITATGNAAATVIDAVDNQSAAPPESQTVDPAGSAPPSERTGDLGNESRPSEALPPEESITTPDGQTLTNSPPGLTEDADTGKSDNGTEQGTTETGNPDPSVRPPNNEESQQGPQPTLAPPSPPLTSDADVASAGLTSGLTTSSVAGPLSGLGSRGREE